MQDLIGKDVTVNAVNIIYKGRLVEVSEKEVFIISEDGWIVVPIESIAEIRASE
ncbi:MAG: hypothetical protein HY758_11225 [Nitrospirae bacterium]|nr:hypothetical protein [Nitrospirota bacterium]